MNKTLLIVLAVAGAAAAAFFLWKKQQAPTPAAAVQGPRGAGDNTAAYLDAGTRLLDSVLDRWA